MEQYIKAMAMEGLTAKEIAKRLDLPSVNALYLRCYYYGFRLRDYRQVLDKREYIKANCGKTAQEIAAELGVTKSYIHDLAREQGVMLKGMRKPRKRRDKRVSMGKLPKHFDPFGKPKALTSD